MPGWTEAVRDGWLSGTRTSVSHLSIHTADPGDNGANEVAGGTPAYERAAITPSTDLTAVSSASFATEADIDFDGPANEDALFVGAWDGSTFLGGGAITGGASFSSEGEFRLLAGTSFGVE